MTAPNSNLGTLFVTGASSGIGAATARYFLSQGWHVGLFARRAEALADVAGGAPNAHVLPGDVTDAAQVEAAIATFAETTGRLDVLFNNAGVFTPPRPPDEIPLADWDLALAVNLRGMGVTARAAFAQMRRQSPQGGRILNNGSISATSPREGAGPYTVTKHAITGLTRQIALDGRAFSIACGQIDIGNAETEILRTIVDRARATGATPPPMFDVEEVARAVWHMATLPPEANVLSMTLMATTMPYVGRG
ncbi:MAG: SDR family oxidoreductase [Pseudomonadota bacterium]